MFRNALCLISTSLKTLQALPSAGVCSSRFNIFSRLSGSVRQASKKFTTSYLTSANDVYSFVWSGNFQFKFFTSHVRYINEDDEPPFAINGFGRIGKCVLRLALDLDMNVVAINEPGANIEKIKHSLIYDTVHRNLFKHVIIKDENTLDIDRKIVKVFHESEPENIKWGELPVDYVIESTGKFTEIEKAKRHMAAGVKKVIISAPSKDAPMFVMGVNFDKYTKDMTVVSNASGTTNCAAPLLNIINKHFGVEHCLLTTVHAMTSSQPVLDGVKQRSAAGNMVHSTTGAAKAVGIVIPELKGKVNGDSIRVPVLDVSLLKLYISKRKGFEEYRALGI
ncbi:hypothetical protein ACI65C_000177 [Semiaphis heraclei]